MATLTRSLPRPATTFVGRQRERAHVIQLLTASASARLVTLTGAGGIGKTRLAIEVGAELERRAMFHDGIHLVELAPLRGGEQVVRLVSDTLGLHEEAGRSFEAVLLDAIRPRHMLLLLDNCEHVLLACAELVSALLRTCSGVAVLATSREPLGIPGETTRRVPSLERPDPKALLHLDELRRCESVRLFVDRASAASSDFALTQGNARSVARVCAQLDGIPLALELAATRVRALSVQQIADRFQVHFGVLRERARGVAERHQTLESTIAWSYDLLDGAEQQLFRGLAVFAGGWTLEDAAAVASVSGDEPVEDLLMGLIEKSLVVAEDLSGGEKSCRLLEPIRQFALERLELEGELHAARQRHFERYLGLSMQADRNIRWTSGLDWPTRLMWLTRLAHAYSNLRAAHHWALETDQVDNGLRLATGMFTYFWSTGHIVEGREWLARLLARQTDAPPTPGRAWAIGVAAALAGHDGDDVAARYFAQEYLAFPEACRTNPGLGLVHGALRQAALREGDLPAARHHATVALAAAVEANEIARPFYRVNLGEVALAEGHLEEAHRLFQEAMSEARPLELPVPIGLALDGLARVARARGDFDLAVALNEQALGFLHAHRDIPQAALVHVSLASLALERDDFELARAHVRQALDAAVEQGYRQSLVAAIAAAALTLVKQAPYERVSIELAVKLAEGARALQAETTRTARGSADAPKSVIAHAYEVLGATYTEALVSQARALSMDELVAQSRVALTDLARSDTQEKLGPAPKLSPREKQVAALVVQGYSNQQIADALVIGRRTAEMHVGNLLSKLGLETRAQLAVWAVQRGLVDSHAHQD